MSLDETEEKRKSRNIDKYIRKENDRTEEKTFNQGVMSVKISLHFYYAATMDILNNKK